MAIKVLSSLGHIGCPNLGPHQTSDPSDVEVGAIYACWHPCTASMASAYAVPPSATNKLELRPRTLPASGAPAATAILCCSLLLLCCWHVAGVLQPVSDKVGPVHSSATLPGRICLSLADSLLLCTV